MIVIILTKLAFNINNTQRVYKYTIEKKTKNAVENEKSH